MKRSTTLIVLILFLFAGSAIAQPDKDKLVNQHGKKYYIHIVHKGETVYGVSRDFNVGAKDIVLENPKAIDGISPGDTLNIPLIVSSPAPNTNARVQKDTTINAAFIYHKVEPKETLYSMTKQFNVSAAKLDSLNPELKEKGLKAGMTLRIPNRNAPPTVTNNNQPNKADTSKQKQAFKDLVSSLGNNAGQPKAEGKLFSRYNIAVLLTFSPQEVDSIKMKRLEEGTQQFPLLVQIATDFYAGFKLALDSLAMQGLNAELHVFNIPPDSASRKIDSILALPTMASANLIIGPPYPSLFNRIAKFALIHQIPIVSSLSPDNSVLKDNPFASKAVPSSVTEIEQTADYLAMHHHQDNIILVHNNDAANDNFYEVFRKRLKATLSIVDPKADSVVIAKYSDDMSDIGHKISDKKYNVIVVPYQGNSFVPKMVNQLANSKYNDDDSICIFGMQNWSNMDVLDPNNLDTLHLHFPSNDYVDYADHSAMRFIQKYRGAYVSEPGYYSFQGFDIGYFYGSMLKKYGTALQDHLTDEKYKGVHTSFDFYRPDPTGGLENKAIYMMEYRDYSMVKDSL